MGRRCAMREENAPIKNSGLNGSEPQDPENTNDNEPNTGTGNSAERAASETPLLPIDGFPTPVKEFIEICARTYGTPRDYWAGAVLASTALAIGDKIEIVGKYRDVPITWFCNVGDVSTGKTEPLKMCLKFFENKDDLAIQRHKENSVRYGVDADTPEDNAPREKPKCLQYIIKDATPEAMAVVHSVNNRGIMYYRDELKGWIDDFGRYNKSGEQSCMLSTFSRVSMTINRKNSEPISIPKPCILIAGGMQPDLIPSLAKDDRAESGFMARFAFIYPDNALKPNYTREVLPEGLMDSYNNGLDYLTSLSEPLTIRLSEAAEEEYERWYNFNANAINRAPNGYLKGVFGKLDIYCLRLVTIIRGMRIVHEGAGNEEVTLNEMKAAITITEYFRTTAMKVYERIYQDHQPATKRAVARYLFNNTNMSKTQIADLLITSRSRLDQYLK